MLLEKIYKFDWKLQNIWEKPNFLNMILSNNQKSTLSLSLINILQNIFYRWENAGHIIKSYVDTEMPQKPRTGYYVNLSGDIEHSVYFLESHMNSYCFDKELLKLYWSKYSKGKDDNYTEERVMYDLMIRIQGWSVKNIDRSKAKIDKQTMKEVKAIMWLWLVGAYFGFYKELWEPKVAKFCKEIWDSFQGLNQIFHKTDTNLKLFWFDQRQQTNVQVNTFINPDYDLFNEFMETFLDTYKIDKGLWGLFLQKLFELKNPYNVLVSLWKDALENGWMENENNYGFFYLLWKYIGHYEKSNFFDFLSKQKTGEGLYDELKKREDQLIIDFSTTETVLAFFALEFFTNFFFILWWHNQFLSSTNAPMVDTRWRFTVLLGSWMEIIAKYTESKEWFANQKARPVFSLSKMPHKTFFSEPIRNVYFNEDSNSEFEETHDQVDTIAVTRLLNQESKIYNLVDGYPLLIRLYSKKKFELDKLVDSQGGVKSKAERDQERMAKNQDIEGQVIMWPIELDDDILGEIKLRTKDWQAYSPEELEKKVQQVEDEAKTNDFEHSLIQSTKDTTDKEVQEVEEEVFSNLFTDDDLYEALRKQIFGQDAILKHISEKIYSYLVLKKCNDKPLTFFLVWPPWTGKTYLSEVLVKVLNEFIRDPAKQFNAQAEMATNYQDSATLSKLLGASASYAWHGDKINFFEELLKKKNQIILFDEIEKGSPALYPFFLDFMNNGKFETNDGQYGIYMGNPDDISYLPKGEKVHHLENVILIFASNAITSEEEVKKLGEDAKFASEQNVEKFSKAFIGQNRTLRTALGNWKGNKWAMMDKAFLDRLQLIYLFNNLSEEYLKEIVVNKFEKSIKNFHMSNDEKKIIILKFKAGFLRSNIVKEMKNAHSMRELQAILDDWIARSIIETRKQKTKTLKKKW